MHATNLTSQEIITSILIVGAGPAGIAAAVAAAAHAQGTVILDENSEAGGQIWRRGLDASHPQGAALYAQLVEQPHVQCVFGARVIAVVDAHRLMVETPHGVKIIQWDKLIVCTGARELLLPFPGWTLPGVTGAGALQALIKSGADLSGRRVVVAGTGPLLLAVAATVKKAGGEVVAVVEQRPLSRLWTFASALFFHHRPKWWQALGLLWMIKPWRYKLGTVVSAAQGVTQVQSVSLQTDHGCEEVACDLLACGFGLRSNLALADVLLCQSIDGAITVDEQQRTSQPHIWAAGEATGIGGVDKALIEGRIAGLSATDQPLSTEDMANRNHAQHFARLLQKTFNIDPHLAQLCQPDTLVCRCEDVAAKELTPFSDWRTAKLMTRVGMGACQGRICGAACEFLYGWEVPEARQPVFPAKASSLAMLAEPLPKSRQ